ncbi:extensin-like [Homarus americanus]|uniref:extensin-like n=1 Tax=Homarus americanus TaxID=6706 RepID=UPI001C4560D2|nr:extensin-like [Homarus americanus]XP_042224599.1 extensin-like [Homarus americanus]XP_042224600.1 extensin-like [Homarus americanus]XP_042224601.1 extensin-like [Homarus americanus]
MSRSSDHKLIPHPDSQAPSAPPVGEYLQQATSEKNPINPPYPEPPPPYSLQAPTYNQPAPTYNQPAPAYNQPAPTYNQPAPAYNQPAPTCNQPAPTCNQPAPVSMAGMYGQPSPAQAVGAYPQQAPATTVVIAQQPMVPVNTQPTPVILVGTQALPPGTCSVCRKGRIKKSPSCCTWVCCILLLPCFIIPGIIAFFCCAQKPKCTHCGYSP